MNFKEKLQNISIFSLRSAINRHFSDIGRPIDIIRGTTFKTANRTLDGLLKEMTKTGASRPTAHKPIVEDEDLKKISKYFQVCRR